MIDGFETRLVQVPRSRGPLGDMPGGPLGTFVTIEVHTGEGIEGVAYAGWSGSTLSSCRILKVAIDELLGQVVGQDALDCRGISRRLRKANEIGAAAGVVMRASSAIDIALWDIRGKALGMPLWKLLGGKDDSVPVYASGHFMPSYSLEEIERWARALMDAGFRAMKLHARPPFAGAVERMRVLREAVGPDVQLMVDCGQTLTVPEAVRVGHALEAHGLAWLEDPIDHEDYAGLTRIADALEAPVCAGELLHGLQPFKHLLTAGAVDILMVDLYRAGGITGFFDAAALAAGFNIPVASHLVPEFNLHVMAAIPNAFVTEHAPWGFPLWKQAPVVADGRLHALPGSGLGLEFDDAALERYRIA